MTCCVVDIPDQKESMKLVVLFVGVFVCCLAQAELQIFASPLTETRFLPWNSLQHLIDPTLVFHGETLYCYFVGSANVTDIAGKSMRGSPASPCVGEFSNRRRGDIEAAKLARRRDDGASIKEF